MSKFKSINASSIIKFQNGDARSANDIIVFYEQRIEKAIKASYSTTNLGFHISIDDLTQEGLLHFLDAGRLFDVDFKEEKQNTDYFFNFCIKKMHWRLLDYVRLLRRRHSKSRENTSLLKDNSESHVEEVLMPDVIFKNYLNKELSKLSARDKSICIEILKTENISEVNLKKLGLNKVYCFSIYRNFKNEFTKNASNSNI